MDGLSPANVTYGAGAVLIAVIAAIMRGLLVPGPTHNRAISMLDKAEARNDQNAESLRKLAESYERIKRNRT